jgi:hypothetical protein
MNWRVVVRPEAEDDVVEAAYWYESRSEGTNPFHAESVKCNSQGQRPWIINRTNYFEC